MKKHLALVLALVMVLSSFSFVSAAPDFPDVKDTPFEEAVMSLELLNVLKGYPDGTFKPANTITRAEFATVAVRVSGLETAAVAAKGLPTGFSDVPAHHWASGYVGTAAKLGIVNGIGGGLFAPETPVKYEEAITMIVRALGYEPAAQAKGGYPFGYLIVANEIDLLDGAMGTQGTWATRGFVAQITFNALETEMMIQSGYGSETRFVVSGTEGTKEKYLIDQMGFKSVEGMVEDYDVDDLEIEVYVEVENGVELSSSAKGSKTYDVMEGFDFYKVHGVTVKAWLDGDKVLLTKLQDNVMFDATSFGADDDEIELITADKKYDLDKDANDFYFNGLRKDFDDDDFNADYAKVVMDGNKVLWADGVDFDDMIVVDEIDDDVIVDLNDNEADVEDYLIVKDGKTISIDTLEKGDVVFLFNDDYFDYDGFAVVATIVKEGVVTKAYSNAFKLDGTTYDLATGNMEAMYLDGTDLGVADEDALSAFEDEGEKIKVVLNFEGDVVLMDGTRGEPATSTYGAILTKTAVAFDGRRGKMIAWDLVNEMGEKVSFDEDTTTTEAALFPKAQWSVVEYTIEDNGDLEDVDYSLSGVSDTATLKVSDRYTSNVTGGKRLVDSTVVFLVDETDEEVDKVFTWKDAKDHFGETDKYTVYSDGGEVTYLVVFDSDAGGDYTWTAGVVTKTRKLAGTNKYEVTLNIDGTKKEIEFEISTAPAYGTIWEFEVNDDMNKGRSERVPLAADGAIETEVLTTTASSINIGAKTFRVDRNNPNTEYELVRNAVVFDQDGTTVTLRDLDNFLDSNGTANLTIYFDGRIKDLPGDGIYSGTFVKYVVVTNYNK